MPLRRAQVYLGQERPQEALEEALEALEQDLRTPLFGQRAELFFTLFRCLIRIPENANAFSSFAARKNYGSDKGVKDGSEADDRNGCVGIRMRALGDPRAPAALEQARAHVQAVATRAVPGAQQHAYLRHNPLNLAIDWATHPLAGHSGMFSDR